MIRNAIPKLSVPTVLYHTNVRFVKSESRFLNVCSIKTFDIHPKKRQLKCVFRKNFANKNGFKAQKNRGVSVLAAVFTLL